MSSIHEFRSIASFATLASSYEELGPNDLQEQWFLNEKQKLAEYWELLCEFASARCWSQTLFTTTIPNSFAAILHDNEVIAQQHLDLVRNTWNAVLKAERIAVAVDTPRKVKDALKKILADHVVWNRLQISRELLLCCQQGGWTTTNQEIRNTAFGLFANPANTKFDLEDVFAHLASTGRLATMATPFSKNLVVH